MDLDTAIDFARAHRQATLTTIRNDGKPQISNILQQVGDDGLIRISITATRAKYKNLLRRPWAALHVSSPDFWSYAVLESDVTFSEVATKPDDDAVEELVDLYRALVGEHPDWDEYRAAMVDEQRVVARLAPNRAYGMVRLPRASGT
jgi:PPOX class probable F420-dependent enzyme